MNLNPTQSTIQAGPATHLVADQRDNLPPEKGLLQRFSEYRTPRDGAQELGTALIIFGVIGSFFAAGLAPLLLVITIPLFLCGLGISICGSCN